jgi:hypothetical protein
MITKIKVTHDFSDFRWLDKPLWNVPTAASSSVPVPMPKAFTALKR